MTQLELQTMKKEAVLKTRADWAEKSSRLGRKRIALSILEKSLLDGVKPVKGSKSFQKNEGGTFKLIRLDKIPLRKSEIKLKKKQISSLKAKLK